MGIYDYSEYISLTMEFRCNLACEHCMIEGTMDRLAPQSDGRLEEVFQVNAKTRRWKGIILTGSEITLNRELPNWARRARQHGFEHVRIQTHGMRLGNMDYCEELVEAGVDEYFVSIAGHDATTHDGITCVPGSFDKSIRGLENLEKFAHVTSITNTVVTERSYRSIVPLVERLGPLKNLKQMEFWTYWPMTEREDKKNLIASHLDILPHLRAGIARLRQLGRGIEVKNFPECLLGPDRDTLNNDQPQLLIDPSFWNEFERNGFYHCVYRDRCASTECLGLNSAYVQKFGEHADVLKPYAPAPGQPLPPVALEAARRKVIPIVPA